MKIILILGFCFFTYSLIVFEKAKEIIQEYFSGNCFNMSPKSVKMMHETVFNFKKMGLTNTECLKKFMKWANFLMFISAFLGIACLGGFFMVN